MNATFRFGMPVALLLSTWLGIIMPVSADTPLLVHEWGTFTVLQDEAGNALPGVNVNEESLPSFVHRLDYRIIPPSDQFAPLRRLDAKALPQGYPGAIMRMETPVIYLYPPKAGPLTVDIGVQFRGGWVTEWFPKAEIQSPGFQPNGRTIGKLRPESTGSIRWRKVVAGRPGRLPETDEHVWLAPRVSSAATLTGSSGESEKYLFYRGVANIHSPLRVKRDQQRDTLSLSLDSKAEYLPTEEMSLRAVWLVDIRADGTAAFREFGPFTIRRGETAEPLATTPAAFQEKDYSPQRLSELVDSMHAALLNEGLFREEADAMLSTWKVSYFNSPGLRVFYTLPQAWTDSVLPMQISQEAKIKRVMIGRIELVTPAQRKLVQEIAAGPISPPDWLGKQLERLGRQGVNTAEIEKRLDKGTLRFSDYNLQVPADYQAFIDLGRFREALVLDGLRREPSFALRRFTDQYHLRFMDGVSVEPGPTARR